MGAFIESKTWVGSGEGTGEEIDAIGTSIRNSPRRKSTQPISIGEFSGVIADPIRSKGFGFIKPDSGGEDVFFHIRNNPNGESFSRGQAVNYGVMSDPRSGRQLAVNVSPL
ncbi:Cold shock protein CspA [compost metagenome]